MEEEILNQRTAEANTIISHISNERSRLEEVLANPQQALAKLRWEDRDKFLSVYNTTEKVYDELRFSEKSPFFVRLELKFNDKSDPEIVYIGKFSFLSDLIYSWTAPVAELRFVSPGPFSYTRPNGEKRSGVVFNREDYFIANKAIISLHQITNNGRITIHDEQLAFKKKEYGLSDIVRELERAQNEIILLDPRGLMAISGPAGSGKTTLALHRLAYMLQNPDTSEWYKPEKTIVLIQDESSIVYFSSLFKNLGVDGVQFMSFESWCSLHLDLDRDVTFVDRYGPNGITTDWIEWNKVRAVREISSDMKYTTDPWKLLRAVYKNINDANFKEHFKKQQVEKIIDKQDLTALLKTYLATHKNVMSRFKLVRKKKGEAYVNTKVRVPVEYDAILVDEFENYTPDQLEIIRTTFSKNASGLFVGDMNQQTRFGSIARFADSDMAEAHNIVLGKVYRNSAAVLDLVKSLGYTINAAAKEGDYGNKEWIIAESGDYQNIISQKIAELPDQHIGIVCCDPDRAAEIKEMYTGSEYVHVGTVIEMQGLEFESVIVLDVHEDLFKNTNLSESFDSERKQILREQVYVAITRARNNIIVLSNSSIESVAEIIKNS